MSAPRSPPYVYGGPGWTDVADYGFQTVNSGIMELGGTSPWEPDGTPIAQAEEYHIFTSASPGVTYTFDLPDGAVINAVYATWATRNKDGTTWNYSEVTTGTTTVANNVAPTADLVLKWTDDAAGVHNGNFQRLFTGPITVTGDDGFRLGATKASQNAGHIDAVVLDVMIPAAFPTTGALILVK